MSELVKERVQLEHFSVFSGTCWSLSTTW